MSVSQPDLFSHDTQPDLFADVAPDFVERIREELEHTLARVREAETLPWADLTRTTLAERRFHSIAGYLPDAEADALRRAFEAEMARLYVQEDARADS